MTTNYITSNTTLQQILKEPMLILAIKAINDLDKWEFMKTYEPPINKGFMFDNNIILQQIKNKICDYYGHTGSSYGYTMRFMQFLAKNEMNIIIYLQRRDYLLFIESIKDKNIFKLNQDVFIEIGKFL